MTASFAALQDELQQLRQRAEKTIAIVEADASDRRIAQLPKILQPERIAVHVRRAVGQAEVHLDPCPYMVVDELLPRDVYDVLVAAIPPRVLFEDRPVNKQQIKIPPPLAPALSRQVWHFMANEVLKGPLGDTVFERLKGPLLDYLHRFWPDYRLDDPEVPISVSDGRIILRRAGYVIPPHRDPRWGFITIILYLARPGDPAQWGTQFYRVRDDADAGTAVPYWIDEARCEQVRDVPFVANRAVVFVNSDGAHGASIPTDAPPDFERYICQWRLGPDSKAMKVLMSRLAPAHRAAWEGKAGY